MSQAPFYRAQAKAAEAAAEATSLDNVRERCLRSAAAWHDMALRSEHTDRLRAERTPAVAIPNDMKVELT